MSSRKTPGGRSASRPDSPSERIKLRIRKARPSDREPLLAMSEGIWGGSDYLPLVLDAWLADEKGVLLTATLDGKPVGLSKVSVLSPGEVWLEGLRLHPDLQGKGLVKQINRASFRAAMRLKPRTVRYSTGAGNAISRHLGEMRGFWLVARTNWLWGAARKGERLSSRVASERELDAVQRCVEASECYEATGGLYARGWKFPALNRRSLRGLIKSGRVLVAGTKRSIRGVAVCDVGSIDGEICLGFLDGTDEAMADLARDALRLAGAAGFDDASAMLPVGRFADAAREAGYALIIPVDAVVYELGARGFDEGDEPLESVLWRTLRTSSGEVTDLVVRLLKDRAPRELNTENVRDFVTRNLLPDTTRETYALVESVQYRLEGWALRAVLRGIAVHFVERYGIGGDSIRTTRDTVSFWLGDARLATVRLARRSITLTVGPGFGPCFDAKARFDADAVTRPESEFDEKAGRYGAITLKLSRESQVKDATRAIDMLMKRARAGGRARR